MVLVGLAAVVGAGVAPWSLVPLGVAVGGVLALVGLGWMARGPVARGLAFAGAAALLGLVSAGSSAPPPPLPGPVWLRGVVVDGPPRRPVVSTEHGRYTFFSPHPVARGAPIAALIRPAPPPGAALDGEPPDDAVDARGARRPVAALAVSAGAAGPPLPGLGRFAVATHGGFLRALVTGEKSGIPADTLTLLERTGTQHLVAVSGLQLALIGGALGALARLSLRPLAGRAGPLVHRLLPVGVAVGACVAYGAALGWPVSAARAAVMVGAGGLAVALGRRPGPAALLGLAAYGVALASPADVGTPAFFLSFGAVLGIVLWAPRWMRFLPPDAPRLLRAGLAAVAASLAATLGTLPVLAWWFQGVAPGAAFANVPGVPLLGGVAVVCALLVPVLPGPLWWAPLAVGDATVTLGLACMAPFAADPWPVAVGGAGALALALLVFHARDGLGAALLGLLLLQLRPLPGGVLRVFFLDIGQGDATFVEMPDGRRLLVDGGPGDDEVLRWLRRRGVGRLDAVVLSHPHPDHLNGLGPVLAGMPVGALFVPRPPEVGEEDFLALWQSAFARGVPIGGPAHAPGPGLRFVHPLGGFRAPGRDRVNEESLVLEVTHAGQRVLLTGDIEDDAERWLGPRLGPVTVLKAPHHGSHSSSTGPLIRATAPAVIVVSCGRENRYRHPRPEMLLRTAGIPIYRTDRDGTVVVELDGGPVRVGTGGEPGPLAPVQRAAWRPLPPPGMAMPDPDGPAEAHEGARRGAGRTPEKAVSNRKAKRSKKAKKAKKTRPSAHRARSSVPASATVPAPISAPSPPRSPRRTARPFRSRKVFGDGGYPSVHVRLRVGHGNRARPPPGPAHAGRPAQGRPAGRPHQQDGARHPLLRRARLARAGRAHGGRLPSLRPIRAHPHPLDRPPPRDGLLPARNARLPGPVAGGGLRPRGDGPPPRLLLAQAHRDPGRPPAFASLGARPSGELVFPPRMYPLLPRHAARRVPGLRPAAKLAHASRTRRCRQRLPLSTQDPA